MNLNKDLFNVVVAAAVAAVTAAGTSYLVLRYAPLGMSTGIGLPTPHRGVYRSHPEIALESLAG